MVVLLLPQNNSEMLYPLYKEKTLEQNAHSKAHTSIHTRTRTHTHMDTISLLFRINSPKVKMSERAMGEGGGRERVRGKKKKIKVGWCEFGGRDGFKVIGGRDLGHKRVMWEDGGVNKGSGVGERSRKWDEETNNNILG